MIINAFAKQNFCFSLFLVLSAISALAFAAPKYPVLTDRVVDQANILSSATEAELKSTLSSHEANTGNQIVVVTLKSLEGYEIADYGYQLGRHWGIGQKDKNNGVLLLIAPNERKVRIEVGYGLEGTLTDALSSYIINQEIVPHFKKNDYNTGVLSGTESIIQTLNQEPNEYNTQTRETNKGKVATSFLSLFPALFFVIFFGELFYTLGRGNFFRSLSTTGFIGLLTWAITTSFLVTGAVSILVFLFAMFGRGSGSKSNRTYDDFGGGFGGGGFGGGSYGGGGFGGGGGSFGGGGASGSW